MTDHVEPLIDSGWAEQLRVDMPSTADWAYLDHAAVAPLPRAAATAIPEWTADLLTNGATHWGQWRQRV